MDVNKYGKRIFSFCDSAWIVKIKTDFPDKGNIFSFAIGPWFILFFWDLIIYFQGTHVVGMQLLRLCGDSP